MLEPTNRSLFTDALRPPSGHTLDLAVGTTYTLSLRMLLLPPLAMAAHDREAELPTDDGGPGADTLALLESVRRYADRTSVYCHAGGIGSPGSYPRLLTFAEDCLVQVLPRAPGRIFHPKVWALRFRQGDSVFHRLVVGSRNLSEDTSWDTLLVLDEGEPGRGVEGRPAAEFIRHLPDISHGAVAAGRAEQADDLASSLATTWFTLPEPFTGGTLWPLGVGTDTGWPMPVHPERALVISPFLDAATTARVDARSRPTFVSRPESYAVVGGRAFERADVRVLSPHAEAEMADRQEVQQTRPSEVRTGLHAKILVWDEGINGHLFTGSANATAAAFTGNVEFGVLLTGARGTCGVEAMLPPGEPSRDRIAFGHILEEHTITEPNPQPDSAFQAEMEIERFHAQLLQAGPQLTIEPDGDRFTVTLDFDHDVPASPGATQIRLISRPRTERTPAGPARWPGVRLLDLTPYLEVVTRVPVDQHVDPFEVACVIKTNLVGDPDERSTEVLRSYLGSEDSIVRYLRFLLDEDDSGMGWDELEPAGGAGQRRAQRQRFEDLAILEPLLRAAVQGSESLVRVHALLRDLGVDRDDNGAVPMEFLDLWDSIWTATRSGAR